MQTRNALIRGIGLAAVLMALAPAAGFAVEVSGLYRAEAIVTGQGEAERARGFGIGFAEVVAKLTGDPESSHAAGVQRLAARAGDYIERYQYEDRMKGIPVHDEQGTRERPYYLRMTFKRAAMNDALRTLGLTPWASDRPRVMIWLGIKDFVRSYVLDSEIGFGYGQREVLRSLSKELGIPIALPAPHDRRTSPIGYDDIANGDLPRLRSASRRYDADAVLFGTLVVDKRGYWTQTWTLDWNGRVSHDRLAGVTFDVALRAAIARAARRFSAAVPAGTGHRLGGNR